jgi:hypothetical protein
MKRFAPHAAFIFACVFSSPLCMTGPAFAQSTPAYAPELAPADSYFGRLRMSILGMRNAIKDIALRIDGASSDDLPSLFHKLTMVENAVLDLKDQYPQDSWLPQLGLSLAQAFARMSFPGAQVHANDALDWVIADYPSSNAASSADGMRHARVQPIATMNVPIDPTLPSYAIPSP